MSDFVSHSIAQSMSNFQSALMQNGDSLESFVRENYLEKWLGDSMYHVLAIRTTMVHAMHQFLYSKGLLNIEKISLSPVTDPLAHDVEHVPSIHYKGHTYVTTHSMIYSKFLACMNPRIKGIFVDSPNIRLELESPTGDQRGKYLIDFSQMDIEVRRNRGIDFERYLSDPKGVALVLQEDFELALSFFEEMLVEMMSAVATRNEADLQALGVVFEEPKRPFPRYSRDDAVVKVGAAALERRLGEMTSSQFFWITGLVRENYDLVYPYLLPNGARIARNKITSEMVYNYDICAQSLSRAGGKYGPAFEVLSGALREWLYEPIIERLIDNKVLPVRPKIVDGNIENIDELGGYGPFILAVFQRDRNGKSLFPDTFGGGLGIERALFSLLRGERIKKVDDVTLFGKNPDSHPLYLY